MQEFHRRVALLFLALLLACAGCIEGNVQNFVRYNPKDDTLWFLNVYTNLNATSKKDEDYLASLWRRRDSILIKPLHALYVTPQGSIEFHIFSQDAIERIGKNQYRLIDLGSAGDKEPEIQVTSLDLDTIRVLPGRFYINDYGVLSCYHQMAVPGATVDAVLDQVTPTVAGWFVTLADEEIQAAKKGAKRNTWDAVRKSIVQRLNEADDPKAEQKNKEEPAVIGPWEEESIRLLKSAVADKSVKLRRTGSVFMLVVPLTKKDCAEVTATFDLAKNTMDERIKAGKKVDHGFVDLLHVVHVRYAEGSGLELSVDLVKLARIQQNVDPKPDEKKAAEYKATIEAIQARGIEIKENFSIKSLVGEYVN